MKTYNDIYFAARKKLRELGIETYDTEARLMAAKAAGKTVAQFLRDSHMYLTDDMFERNMAQMIVRRSRGEPLGYITGEWEFYGIQYNVTQDVLIPRVDTELLVDKAIEKLRTRNPNARVLDLCTGSGCVGLSIVSVIKSARVILVDKSPAALSVCRSNILKNRLTKNATCVEADVMQPPPLMLGMFDMVVCNPPYIPTADISCLDTSVKDYEPVSALDGGVDGLDFYRAVTPLWKDVMRRGAWLLYECGIGQYEAVCDILSENMFADISVHKDTLGIERVVMGKLSVL